MGRSRFDKIPRYEMIRDLGMMRESSIHRQPLNYLPTNFFICLLTHLLPTCYIHITYVTDGCEGAGGMARQIVREQKPLHPCRCGGGGSDAPLVVFLVALYGGG